MKSLHLCSRWAQISLWYLLHLSFLFFSVFSALVHQIRSHLLKLTSKNEMKKASSTVDQQTAMMMMMMMMMKQKQKQKQKQQKKKIPAHLAIVVDSEDAKTHLSSVIKVIEQIAQLGFRHVSVYDLEGLLKSVLVEALTSHPAIRCYAHNEMNCTSSEHNESKNLESPRDGMPQIHVEVLCLQDGKQAIVKAVRNLCLKSFHSGLCPDLEEEDINISLRETGCEGPDPDLLLLFSDTQCLSGFPPWRLKQTEIQFMGSIGNFSEQSLCLALDEFSQKEQRYGK